MEDLEKTRLQQAAEVPPSEDLKDAIPQELPADISEEVKEKIKAELDPESEAELAKDVQEAEQEERAEAQAEGEAIPHDRLTRSKMLKLLMKKQYLALRDETEEEHPADLAELLEDLDENNRLVIFRILKKEVAVEAFSYMSDEARNDLIESFSDAELVNTLEEMSLDDAADMLEDMPASIVKRVLNKSSRSTREILNKLLNYPEYSAGSIMTPEYVRLHQRMSVREAFTAIRAQGENAETVYTCYVVERSKLVGVVSTRDLLLADFDTPIVELMDEKVRAVKVTDDQEDVAREMQHYDFAAMPVVDDEGMLVGIVTIDDAVDVLTEESTEDMQKMAAILPSDAAATYFETPVTEHMKQRIPWLMILMLSATVTGMVTTHYESAFEALPLLVSFMPMLMGTAGNCGNQINTLMVRGLALGDVEPRDFLRVLGKELRVSMLVGIPLALVNALRIYLMYGVFGSGEYTMVGSYVLVVSIALFLSVVLAKMVGGMLPLIAKKLGGDPAIMASPFISTIIDACSLIIYFQIAMSVFDGITL